MNTYNLLKICAAFILSIAFTLMCILVSEPLDTRAGGVNKPFENIAMGEGLRAFDYYTSGMHYKVIKSDDGGVFAINVTLYSLTVSELTK